MPALPDLSADELEDVVQTLSEQEPSIPELVQGVLSEVQVEFTKWNVVHCREALASFTPPSTWRSCLHPDLRSPTSGAMSAAFKTFPEVQSEGGDTSPSIVIQEVYSADGAVVEVSSIKLEVIHPTLSVEPCPPYESCSPLHRSVFKGDDSDNMDFIPYADDGTFDQVSHTHHYASFSWQDPFDPDLQVIVLEAAYRLQTHHALTYDEIEECNVLPLKLYSQPGLSGVLSIFRRRDRLHWAGNTIPMSYVFPQPRQSERPDFYSRLKSLNSFFCPNLSCVEPLCNVHVEANPMPVRLQPPPSRTTGAVTNSCGKQCFVSYKTEAIPSWNDADLDIFKVISEISPNATPCVLAELCLKPCCEVFYYKELINQCNTDASQTAGIKGQRRIPKFNDNNASQFTPNDPCHHTGPCNSSSGCPCFKNQSHCQRNCHCSSDCNRRWQGCRCSKVKSSRWSCVTERCPCVEARRECDPELCVNCRSDAAACCNSQIQRGARKELEVKRSNWGLGAFLVEPAKGGELITEYVGELVYEPTVDSRGDLAAHRNRCYVFGLNNTLSLDSTYVGNVSRFIDHSDAERSRRVNSQARVRLVNGEHRIGIFATRDMDAGSEILLNYGTFFFIS